jgi:hypothetical protein
MAYKSQVTNKYYGGTSAGTVASARSTELSQVIDVLKNDFNPAISKLVDAKIDEKKDKAKSKVQELYASGKSIDVINQEILDGKHPDLSGDYVNKTVSYHTGRFKAGEVIAKIKENSDNYDFKTQTLDDFYKPFLPEFKNADGSFALGFGAVFNEWKANQAIADAEKRAEWKHNTKMEKGISYLDTVTNIDENYWKAVSSLGTILPKDKNGKQTYYFDADEQNEVAIKHANSILERATKPEDIDKALKILTSDRGTGIGGNKLGSLLSTNKSEVLDLVSKLNDKRVRLTQITRYETEWKETQEKKEIVKSIFTNNEDGTEKTFRQKLETVEKLKGYGDITLYNSAMNIIKTDSNNIDNNPDVMNTFLVSTASGAYPTLADMVKEYDKQKLPPENLSKAIAYWESWNKNNEKGLKPIWQTSNAYTTQSANIANAVKQQLNGNALYTKEGQEAYTRVSLFLPILIQEQEDKFIQENKRPPTELERIEIMDKINNYVMKTYKDNPVANPNLQTFTQQEEQIVEDQKKLEAKQKKYQEAGVDVPLNNINTILSDKKKLPKLPVMDTSIWKSRNTEVKDWLQNSVQPFLVNFLKQGMGVEINQDMWRALEQSDVDNLYATIIKQFGLSNNEDTTKMLNNVFATILGNN